MTTLLEKALRATYKKTSAYTKEDAELATAWAQNKVTLTQVIAAWDLNSSGAVYAYLAMSLRKALELGLLKNGK